MEYFVYILASKKNGALYIGVTHDLVKRVFEHKTGAVGGFTDRYKITKLVYFEQTSDIWAALQ